MYLHEETGIVYLASERAASRSVAKALQSIGFKQEGAHHDGPDQGYELIPGQPVITTIRNHWDAMVSWWYNLRMYEKETRPTLIWLTRHVSRNRYLFRPGSMWRHAQIPGAVAVRFERLDEDLNRVLRTFGLPQVDIPEVGVSHERERRHYSTYYDSETRLFVRWAFGPEIERFDYDFEEDPPWHKEERSSVVFPHRKPEGMVERPKIHGPAKVSMDAVIVEED